MEVTPRDLTIYQTPAGKAPFTEWLDNLRDDRARARIDKRLARIQLGNLGEYRFVGEGVWELKIDYGPGYRIYFGQVGMTLILLLCGGDKSTQAADILTAQDYWRDYEQPEDSK
jgi:putative addiction module killer protein